MVEGLVRNQIVHLCVSLRFINDSEHDTIIMIRDILSHQSSKLHFLVLHLSC